MRIHGRELEAEVSKLLRGQLRVWRDNEQFFTHEAALGSVVQIAENGLIQFCERSFNAVNFQRPDWIRGSFYTAFKLARLVEITNLDKRGEYFFVFPNRP